MNGGRLIGGREAGGGVEVQQKYDTATVRYAPAVGGGAPAGVGVGGQRPPHHELVILVHQRRVVHDVLYICRNKWSAGWSHIDQTHNRQWTITAETPAGTLAQEGIDKGSVQRRLPAGGWRMDGALEQVRTDCWQSPRVWSKEFGVGISSVYKLYEKRLLH